MAPPLAQVALVLLPLLAVLRPHLAQAIAGLAVRLEEGLGMPLVVVVGRRRSFKLLLTMGFNTTQFLL